MVEEMLLALCSTLSPLMLDKDWSEVKDDPVMKAWCHAFKERHIHIMHCAWHHR